MVTELLLDFSYKFLKLKLRVFLADHTVVIVTCNAKGMFISCSLMFGFSDKEISAKIFLKLLSATVRSTILFFPCRKDAAQSSR